MLFKSNLLDNQARRLYKSSGSSRKHPLSERQTSTDATPADSALCFGFFDGGKEPQS